MYVVTNLLIKKNMSISISTFQHRTYKQVFLLLHISFSRFERLHIVF